MLIRTDTIRTPEITREATFRTTSEDIVREVLNFPAEARPSCNPQSGDASQPSGDDVGRSPNPFESTDSISEYRSKLCEALLLAQDCFIGLDATELIGFKPDQLSQMDKNKINKEYARWIQNELAKGGSRKGPRRRARRREATVRDSDATGPAEAMGRRKRRRVQYARVQKAYHSSRTECARKVLSHEWEEGVASTIPLDDQVSFWSEVFGTPSRDDDRTTVPQGRVLWERKVDPRALQPVVVRRLPDGRVPA